MKRAALIGALVVVTLAALVVACAGGARQNVSCHIAYYAVTYGERCIDDGSELTCTSYPISQPVYACESVTATPAR